MFSKNNNFFVLQYEFANTHSFLFTPAHVYMCSCFSCFIFHCYISSCLHVSIICGVWCMQSQIQTHICTDDDTISSSHCHSHSRAQNDQTIDLSLPQSTFIHGFRAAELLIDLFSCGANRGPMVSVKRDVLALAARQRMQVASWTREPPSASRTLLAAMRTGTLRGRSSSFALTWLAWATTLTWQQTTQASSQTNGWVQLRCKQAKKIRALFITKCEGTGLSLVTLVPRRHGIEA